MLNGVGRRRDACGIDRDDDRCREFSPRDAAGGPSASRLIETADPEALKAVDLAAGPAGRGLTDARIVVTASRSATRRYAR